MSTPSISARHSAQPTDEQCPYFGCAISDWWALQPAERAEVILAAYQERLLPELARLERRLTRLAIEYGLEYCRVEELAVYFLDIAREIRDHVQALEMDVLSTARNGRAPDPRSMDGSNMQILLTRLSTLTSICVTDQQTSPCYGRLVEGLRICQQELTELVELEAELAG